MSKLISITVGLCITWLAVLGGANRGPAAEHAPPPLDPAAVLAPFLSDDTFAVGYVDLSAVDPVVLADELLATVGKVPTAQRQEPASRAQVAKTVLDGVRASGIRTAYVVGGLGDMRLVGGPLVVVDIQDPAGVEAAEAMLRGSVQMIERGFGLRKSELHVGRHHAGVILIGSEATLRRYQSVAASPRRDLAKPLAQMAQEGAAVAVVFAPGQDFRRVVRELWPSIEPQALLKTFAGEFLADRFRYVQIALHVPPKMAIRATAQMSDPDAAKAVAQLVRNVPALIDDGVKDQDLPEEARSLMEPFSKLLTAKVDGNRATVRLDIHDPNLASLWKLVAMLHDEAINASLRNRRMADLKQLALAMYACNASKHPRTSVAIRDAEGRPLLSWRVAILLHLGQDALYKEFHLDEPWDSPHNRELVKKMPAVFADPGQEHVQLANEGKTTYLVPVGLGTVFGTDEGGTLRDIANGPSGKIMIVQVAPDRAVEWTRPADWEVDLEHPLEGVKQPGRDYFVVAFFSGMVQVMPTYSDPAVLRAMLTRAGGEKVVRP